MVQALDRVVGATAFGSDVAGYAAGRPDYPDALYSILAEQAGLVPGAEVLEIGPGTGQATRRMLYMGAARLVAVEPDPALAAHLGAWGEPRLQVLHAGFGDEGLAPSSLDLIVAATAFHWLDAPSALVHALALLRPGGHIALWWNVFHELAGDPLFDMLFEGLARPPSLLGGAHYSLDEPARRAELETAGFGEVRHTLLMRELEMTPARLTGLYATFSAVRHLPEAEREARLRAVEACALATLGSVFTRSLATSLYIAAKPD